MSKRLDEGDLGEYHVAATYSMMAGATRVEIDPADVIAMVEEILKHRREREVKS
jgi:hypothetical protein